MNRFTKMLLVAATIVGSVNVTLAALTDKGVGKKNKHNTSIYNIATPLSLKNSMSLNLTGLNYKGSFLSSKENISASSTINTSVITYQKGNMTYIIPYKHKMAMPEIQQGYTGIKLIIRSHK
ncbi:MAG: hypothetical protein HY305_06330 [Sphingobacteriales bacterium]|nr:hypothetical protein [Sphingobacteriales bacterium]